MDARGPRSISANRRSLLARGDPAQPRLGRSAARNGPRSTVRNPGSEGIRLGAARLRSGRTRSWPLKSAKPRSTSGKRRPSSATRADRPGERGPCAGTGTGQRDAQLAERIQKHAARERSLIEREKSVATREQSQADLAAICPLAKRRCATDRKRSTPANRDSMNATVRSMNGATCWRLATCRWPSRNGASPNKSGLWRERERAIAEQEQASHEPRTIGGRTCRRTRRNASGLLPHARQSWRRAQRELEQQAAQAAEREAGDGRPVGRARRPRSRTADQRRGRARRIREELASLRATLESERAAWNRERRQFQSDKAAAEEALKQAERKARTLEAEYRELAQRQKYLERDRENLRRQKDDPEHARNARPGRRRADLGPDRGGCRPSGCSRRKCAGPAAVPCATDRHAVPRRRSVVVTAGFDGCVHTGRRDRSRIPSPPTWNASWPATGRPKRTAMSAGFPSRRQGHRLPVDFTTKCGRRPTEPGESRRRSRSRIRPNARCPDRPTRRTKPPSGPTSTACGTSPTRPPVPPSPSTRRSRRREKLLFRTLLLTISFVVAAVLLTSSLSGAPATTANIGWAAVAACGALGIDILLRTSHAVPAVGDAGAREADRRTTANRENGQNASLMLFASTGPVYLGMIARAADSSRWSARRASSCGAAG